MAQRTGFLLRRCEIMLGNAGWVTAVDGSQVKAFRLRSQYDEISVKIEPARTEGIYSFTVIIQKNEKHSSKTFNIPVNIINDDERLSGLVLSCVPPEAIVRNELGNFRKAFKSIISFGYSRTRDDNKFYPVYAKGNIHIDWRLEYDPSARIFLKDTALTVGDYILFEGFFDWASIIRENFFNIDLLLYGRNKYSGSPDHGTRVLYGFFNGLEYFRPGFANSAMTWNDPINRTQPAIQYSIWRALQWNTLISHRNGAALYTASFMAGAGMGVGPSSLFATDLSAQDEENLSHVFRSIRYRKQNYYFSYTLPARVSLSADNVYGFYFEFGYNYYYFYPVLTDTMYDMLHVFNCITGYYLTYDVMLASEYESWWVVSMLNHDTRMHHWNRLIFEFKNFF